MQAAEPGTTSAASDAHAPGPGPRAHGRAIAARAAMTARAAGPYLDGEVLHLPRLRVDKVVVRQHDNVRRLLVLPREVKGAEMVLRACGKPGE